EVLRKFLGTLVNVYSFFTIYANIDQFNYDNTVTAVDERPEIDRWILSSLNGLVAKVDELLSRYDLTRSARSISAFVVDDLSNWYVRRCRRRFWKSEIGADKLAAYETLYEVLYAVAKLMAPFAPFIAEEIYINLTREQKDKFESVHLTNYPAADSAEYAYRDPELEDRMNTLRRVVLLGRALRNESGIKVRQPLSRIMIVAKDRKLANQIKGMANLITEELNVKNIEFIADENELTVKRALPQFKQLGPRFGRDAKSVANRIRALGEEEIKELEEKGEFQITTGAKKDSIRLDDVEIISESAEGIVVQDENGLTVALDLKVTQELRFEGLAREFVNRVQNMRKNSGLDVVDRIKIYYQTTDELLKAIEAQSKYICTETLAESISTNSGKATYTEDLDIDGIRTTIGIEKIS
ncbi:MAG: DUF5915 domain-containing protein, partial [bacterium]